MNQPKLHHYVPQFYLRLFYNDNNHFWIWDKNSLRIFTGTSQSVAAEKYFYHVPEFVDTEVDPLFLEKNFSDVEGDAADIIYQCVNALDNLEPKEKLDMDDEAKRLLSFFIASQFLRTRDQRDIFSAFTSNLKEYNRNLSSDEEKNLHARLICDSGIIEQISDKIFNSSWIYARNTTNIPFCTSDNPVVFKTEDNTMWLKGPGIMDPGVYVIFPLTPKYILYCHGYEKYPTFKMFDSCLSPVIMDNSMVYQENRAHVFMSTRHVVSPVNEFNWAEEFLINVVKKL